MSGIKRGIIVGGMTLAALAATSATAGAMPVTEATYTAPQLNASGPGAWKLNYQASVSGYFTSVAAINRSNAWAVADLLDSHNRAIYRPFIRHWNGRNWSAVAIPKASGFESDWVRASSASNVWVIGLSTTGDSRAYRYDGRSWHKVPVPALTFLTDPVVLGRNDVWALGSSGTLSGDIYHWNGTRWSGFNVGTDVQQLSGTWAKDLWAVGLRFGKLVAYYWNGSRWRAVATPHPKSDDFLGIYVSSISDIWIANFNEVLQFNGHGWRKVATPPSSLPANPANLVPDGRGGLWLGAEAHWTGHAWLGPIPFLPLASTGGNGPMARVPRTSSYWDISGTENFGSTFEKPTIYLYGAVP